MGWTDRVCSEKRMRGLCLRMIELLFVCLIGDEIRLNAGLEESSREFINTSQVQITIGNVQMLNEIIKL